MTCSVEGCDLPVRCRSLCGAHYQRSRTGRPLDGEVRSKPRGDLETRFWAKIKKTDSCWLWTSTTDTQGYGYIGLGARVNGNAPAYRVAYELLVGPIPDGFHIDHLCRVPQCVNPEHLEAVTQAENNRRAAAAITHCNRGHEFTPENTLLRSERQYRACRTCKNERDRATWPERKKTRRSRKK